MMMYSEHCKKKTDQPDDPPKESYSADQLNLHCSYAMKAPAPNEHCFLVG